MKNMGLLKWLAIIVGASGFENAVSDDDDDC